MPPITPEEFFDEYKAAWEDSNTLYNWGFSDPVIYLNNVMNWYQSSGMLEYLGGPQYLVWACKVFNKAAHLGPYNPEEHPYPPPVLKYKRRFCSSRSSR